MGMFNGSMDLAHSLVIASKWGPGGEAPIAWRFYNPFLGVFCLKAFETCLLLYVT